MPECKQEPHIKRHAQVFVILYSSLAMLGCMTTQPLSPNRTQLARTLHPNDTVQIVTNGGQNLKFKVEQHPDTPNQDRLFQNVA